MSASIRYALGLTIAVGAVAVSGLAGGAAESGAVPACVAARVHYEPPTTPGAPKSIPWIRSGRFTGYLFYYSAPGPWREQRDRVLIAVGGRGPGYSTKILWHFPGSRNRLTIRGRRLDGIGSAVFVQQLSRVGGGYFPSIVDVPTPGCWRVTVGTGSRHASFAFVAVDVR